MSDRNEMLVPVQEITAVDLFETDGNVEKLLETVHQKVEDFEGDVESDKGRKEIASMAYKVTRSKTFLDNLGKEHVADLKAKAKEIDAKRRLIRDDLDELKENVREPLTVWEERAKQAEMLIAGFLQAHEEFRDPEILSDEIQAEIDHLETADDFDIPEHKRVALAEAIETCRERLVELRDKAIKREQEAEELERLRREKEEREAEERRKEQERLERERKEKEERERKEREERLRREAVENARREAERKAKEEQERREREYQEELAKERRERERLQEEQRRKEEAEKRRREQEEREKKQAQEEAERKRREAEAAERKRQENEEHRAKIHHEIYSALVRQGDIPKIEAARFVELLRDGEVPHVTVNY